jgi:hypothetical protein
MNLSTDEQIFTRVPRIHNGEKLTNAAEKMGYLSAKE